MRRRGIANTLATATAIGLAAFATGCGSNEGQDAGTNRIDPCPKGFVQGEQPIAVPSQAMQAMAESVAALVAKLEGLGDIQSASFYNYADTESKLDVKDVNPQNVGAASAVFHVHDAWWPGWAYGNNKYIIGQETRVDDLSEVVCSDAGAYYFTPDAESAFAALRTAGITSATEALLKK